MVLEVVYLFEQSTDKSLSERDNDTTDGAMVEAAGFVLINEMRESCLVLVFIGNMPWLTNRMQYGAKLARTSASQPAWTSSVLDQMFEGLGK